MIARLGAAAFFEMLIKNNLIHADCHGGNILVEVTPKRSSTLSLLGTGADNLRKIFRKMEFKLKEKLLDDGTLK